MSNHASISSEGGLLPADLLSRIRARDPSLPGLSPTQDYGLAPGETLNEAASRSWSRLIGLWRKFAEVRKTRKEGDAFEGATLDRWLKPLFQELGFASLDRVRAETIGLETFAISHRWKAVPIHLVGAGLLIDKRTPGARGAATANPHGLLQDYLNRKDEYRWGIVSNGLKLRLLRDNRMLTRQAYLEFNLENIFSAEGQSGYADFFLLWLICHRTRFDASGGSDRDATIPASHDTWIIEVWTKLATKNGVRAQLGLRQNAVRALNCLGSGFLSHRANQKLVTRLTSGELSRDAFKRQLLRTLYRLLFLFVAEDRGLLLDPNASLAFRERFTTYYSTARLRRVARRYGGTAHGDGWAQLLTLFRLLRVDAGCPALGLPPLGGFLFSEGACPDLDTASLANEHLYAALRALCVVQDREERISRVTDFEHLGAEELGGIYESLLELGFKEWSVTAGLCELADAPGNERKLTGSYYTPTSLITSLLDTALDPVLERASNAPDPEAALLALKICDPACGSGHFLVAAGHRLARRLAALRTGEREPPVETVRHALRQVAANCLYGVDVNPLSVELCKVSIWLEALEPGRPLAFLESHIQCGNSLLGCTPALLKKGLPDETFKPLTGDDPSACRALIKDNRDARDAKQDLLDLANRPALVQLAKLPDAFVNIEALPDDSPDAMRQKESRWTSAVSAADYQHEMFLHDAWCAAFVLPRRADDFMYHFHTGHLRKLEQNPDDLSPELRDAIERLAGNAPRLSEAERERSFRFFHWHLRFPGVFRAALNGHAPENPGCGWDGGFDVVIGNPPWERVKISEREWFEGRHKGIVSASTADIRKQVIAELESSDPILFAEFGRALRKAEGESHLLRESGRYPLCGVGDVNTFAVFSELNSNLISSRGRSGFIVPTSVATSDTTKYFFSHLVSRDAIASLYSFFEVREWFPSTDSREPFCLLTLRGTADPSHADSDFIFDAKELDELTNPERRFTLGKEDFERINPNTLTCPIFRSRRDAEITRRIYSQVPVLIRERRGDESPEVNPWGASLSAMFHMSNDSCLFVSRATAEAEGWELRGNNFVKGDDTLLPLYEAKLLHHYDHRWATFLDGEETRVLASGEKIDPSKFVMPRYWVDDRACLLVIAAIPDDLRAVLWKVWMPDNDDDRAEGAIRVRRELGRWRAGWEFLNGDVDAAARLLREVLADPNKKRTEKKWRQEEQIARDVAKAFELTPAEAATLLRILDVPLHEQLKSIWPMLRTRVPKWFVALRGLARPNDERTAIIGAIPFCAAGNSVFLFKTARQIQKQNPYLLCSLCSIVHDYAVRQKVGGANLNFFLIKQFPVLPPEAYYQPAPWCPSVTLADWMRPYVLELCFTAYDLQGFAEDCGYTGAPFRWDDSRRGHLRAELDAAFFHLYGLNRSDTEYVLNTFEVLKKGELKRLGKFDTAERILTAYDAMTAATSSGTPFATRLNPPPADASLTHGVVQKGKTSMNARITRATIHNYRSLAGDGLPVSLGTVTVLVGPNDSGKSSFCDALAFLADAVRNGLPAAINNNDNRRGFASIRRKGSDKITFRIEAELSGISGFYALELEGAADGYRVAHEAAQWRGAFAIKNSEWEKDKRLEGASIPSGATALLLPLLRGDQRFSELAEAIAGIEVYSVPPMILRDAQPKSPASPMDGRGRDWPSALDRVLKGPLGGMLIVALNRLTGDIANVEVESQGSKQVVRFLHRETETTEGGRWATADQESDGTLRAAALLTALAQDPAPSLIAIEEPELAIHPGALSVIYDFIQSAQRRSQVLITTHSPDLLDYFEAELLRVVYREGDVTRIASMEEDQRRAVREKLTTLGNVIRHEGMRPEVEQ
jgi:energy-coupling factor transporter ATP-binding protein EcfA2